jgi:hypothetical protein
MKTEKNPHQKLIENWKLLMDGYEKWKKQKDIDAKTERTSKK